MNQIAPLPTTAADICDALGRKEMAVRLDRTPAAVTNAVSDGTFPSGWYLIIKEMCAERGLDCPPHLFTFLTPEAQAGVQA